MADFERARTAIERTRTGTLALPPRPEFPPGYFRGKDPRDEGIDPSAIDLRGLDLSGARLEGLTLPHGKRVDRLNLTDADISDAILPVHGRGVNLTRAKAHWTNFSHAILPDLVAFGLDGRNSDWFKAVCPNMNATGMRLVSADCRDADFSGIFADYRGVPVAELDRHAPRFIQCRCEGTDFTGITIVWDGDDGDQG